MANVLNMAKQNAIVMLAGRGWSNRRIAKELGIHRDTVSRHIKGLDVESESCAVVWNEANSKQATPAPGSKYAKSLCEPFREIIKEKLQQGLSGQRIYQDLYCEHGFEGAYNSVKRFTRKLRGKPLPFRRMECEPGQEAQVDFGRGARILTPDGHRRYPHIFRIVLSHSRKAYSEAVWKQTTDNYIRALENAFRYFGGVPETLVIDNLRAAVTQADWYEPDIVPKVEAFCRHYGTVILPSRPYMPRHKGKVESSVKYVKNNALKGRVFASIEEQNTFLANWEQNVADTRIHGTTRKQVRKSFEEVERPVLKTLPTEYFPAFHEGKRSVHWDGHVEVDRAYYSVPPEHVGTHVWVRWDTRTLRIYTSSFEQIAMHAKRPAGMFSTDKSHIDSRKICIVEKGADNLLQRAERIGANTGKWAASVLEMRGVQGMRVVQGLVSLAKKHSWKEMETACGHALSGHSLRLRTVRQLIKRNREEEIEFLQEHPLIRSMQEYGQIACCSSSAAASD